MVTIGIRAKPTEVTFVVLDGSEVLWTLTTSTSAIVKRYVHRPAHRFQRGAPTALIGARINRVQEAKS